MNRSLLLLILVAVGGGAWFLIPDEQPLLPEHAPASWTPPPVERVAESSTPDLTLAAHEGARTPVVEVAQTESVTEDPCASVQTELDSVIVACGERDKTIAELTAKLAEVMRERDRLMYADDTPYGAFLASYEADEINDPNALVRIEDWLRQFPVFLSAGEATWIAERTTCDDWKLYGRTSERALIMFLGPDRLVNELPPARVAELRAYYDDGSLFN